MAICHRQDDITYTFLGQSQVNSTRRLADSPRFLKQSCSEEFFHLGKSVGKLAEKVVGDQGCRGLGGR